MNITEETINVDDLDAYFQQVETTDDINVDYLDELFKFQNVDPIDVGTLIATDDTVSVDTLKRRVTVLQGLRTSNIGEY